MAGFANLPDQIKHFWATRTGRQKWFLLGSGALTVVLLTIFARLLSSPDYKPLFKDLDPADAQSLAAQLDAQNIPHQVSADGKTLSVPADKLDVARMQTATKGQPHSGRMGFELFDKMTWGQTEFDEKVAYQRALEGELERTIQTLADVEQARVHLVMPTESVFLDRERQAKASVILKLRRNGLSKDAVAAIGRLVSGAVDGLKPEDVSIIDADSNRSVGPGHEGTGNSEGEEAKLTERLISTLEPVVGANAIRASVNVDYDVASTDESQEKYDPTVSALLSVQRTEDAAGSPAIAGGVPGTASNIPAAKDSKPASTANAQNTQTSKSESAQYAVNKTIVHTITPAGRIQRISAAIVVDDAVVKKVTNGKVSFTRQRRTPDELARIQEIAQAAIGFDAKRGDTISVQSMSFGENSGEAGLTPANWTTQMQRTVSDYSGVLRPLSLLALFMLAYLFVLRPVQKHALSQGMLGAGVQAMLETAGGQSLPAGSAEADHTRRALQLKEQAFQLVKQKPADTARAMQAWMREEQG